MYFVYHSQFRQFRPCSRKCDSTKALIAESSSVKGDGEDDHSLPHSFWRSIELVVSTPSIDLQNNCCSGMETVHYPQCRSVHQFIHPQSLNKSRKTGHPGVASISSLSPLSPLFYLFFHLSPCFLHTHHICNLSLSDDWLCNTVMRRLGHFYSDRFS